MYEDIACGTERFKIPCISPANDELQPSGFTYVASSSVQLQLSSADGCSCFGGCDRMHMLVHRCLVWIEHSLNHNCASDCDRDDHLQVQRRIRVLMRC